MSSPTTLTTVFYLGATGYIGGPLRAHVQLFVLIIKRFYLLGAVLADLVKTYPNLKITALVRNPLHVKTVHDLGVEVVQGSFSDTELISSRARAADITVNSADSDNTALNEAILAGQRARVVEDGKPPPVLFHTSGVAVFSDGGKDGKHDTKNKLWDVRPF